jgi:DNA-binding XRE family transcriptional regulator
VRPTAAQLRAARAWLGWSRSQAAHRAGICYETVSRAERGKLRIEPESMRALRAVYVVHGIEFGAAAIRAVPAPLVIGPIPCAA